MEHKNQDAQLAYQITRIRTASREQLLLITYDIAIRFCLSAENDLAKSKLEEAHESLMKAQAAVRELTVSLNPEIGGKFADGLMALYDFMYRTLVEANVEKDASKVESVRSMLEELRDTWKKAFDNLRRESLQDTPPETVASGGGVSFAG